MTKDKVYSLLQYFIIIILVLLIAYYSYQKFVLKRTSMSFFNTNFYIILSGSMEPTINIKDLVVIHPKDSYEVGDIIAFHRGQSVIVHRIAGSETDEEGNVLFLTKGDANNTIDLEKLSPDNIIGLYRFTIPFLGALLQFLYSNPIPSVVIILALFVGIYVIRLIRENKHQE